MIETMLVSYNADVCEPAEEHERAKFVLFFGCGCCKASEEVASADSFEANSRCLKDAPHETGAVEPVWSSCAPTITRAQALLDRCHEHGLKLNETGGGWTNRGSYINRGFWFCFPNRF